MSKPNFGIGFKTIDEFTLEDCRSFVNNHDNNDPLWEEVHKRYNQLLTQLQNKNNSITNENITNTNYNNRNHNIDNPNAHNQQKHYVGSPKGDKDNIKLTHQRKGIFASLKLDFDKRNPIVNFILYLLLLGSLVSAIVLLPYFIISNQGIEDVGWKKEYGEVFIPGFLLSVATFISVLIIIRWKKYGLALLTILSIIITLPLIAYYFTTFLIISSISLLSVAFLWCILQIKKKGFSTWYLCFDQPRWLNYTVGLFIIIWLFSVVYLPLNAAYRNGFRKNLYSNGITCLSAEWGDDYISYIDLYQSILLGTDFVNDSDKKQYEAERCLDYAKYSYEIEFGEERQFYDDFPRSLIFLTQLIFMINNKSEEDCLDYIDSMKDDVNMTQVFQYLNGDKSILGDESYYKYNKIEVTETLNKAGIYE